MTVDTNAVGPPCATRSLAQGRTVANRIAQNAANPDGFASIGACSRFTPWRVACRAEISLATGICTETIVVSNSLTTVKGYYHRAIAFRHLKCVGAPGPSPPVVITASAASRSASELSNRAPTERRSECCDGLRGRHDA